MRSKALRKAAMFGALLFLSFLAIYLVWYFVIMRGDLEYFLVWRHAFDSPHYPPSIIIELTIMSFVALWAIGLVTYAAVCFIRRSRSHGVDA